MGDRHLRAGAPAQADRERRGLARARRSDEREGGGQVRTALITALKNRKMLVVLGPVLGIVMFGASVKMASVLMSTEYKEPYGAPAATADPTPRVQGLAADKED